MDDEYSMTWSRAATNVVTDHDNRTFDTGRAVVIFVVLNAVVLTWVDVLAHGAKFDAQSYGLGIGGLLTGLAAYVFGDAKSKAASRSMGEA